MKSRHESNSLFTAIVFCAMLLTAPASARAQTPQSAPPAPPAGAAPTDPNRISIDVRVTDRLGHHISGLKAEDFALLDNKQPRKFFDFREVDSRDSAADPMQVIIVIDTINTEFHVVAREREQLTEFLKQDGGRLSHPTSLAVITEKGLKMQPAPSLDGNALIANLDNEKSDLRFIGKDAGFWGAGERLQWSIDQLVQLAVIEKSKPGRKLAFFISPGWPMLPYAGVDETDKQRQWTFNYIVGLSNGLRDAHLTLYAVNPFVLGRTDPFYYQNFTKGIANVNKAEYPDLALQVLVAHSGGLVQVTGMDILGEINTAVRDADAYYTLSFDAPPADRLNEYHDLQLKVDKPGVTVRTTAGYYANVPHGS